ncbi:MAG: hypothetical protein U5L11_15055 [Arhodomonas sp.]|nr:hypothetical protein [Arhodomonas sp.]
MRLPLPTEARDRLQGSLDELVNGDAEAGIPPTSETSAEAAAALEKVVRPWEQMRGDVNAILERRDMVIQANVIAERFRAEVPRIQEAASALSVSLAEAGSARQATLAAELALLAEQVSRNIGDMVRGGFGNVRAADRLRAATEGFETTLAELRGSGLPAGIPGREVAALGEQFRPVREEVDALLEQSPELFRVRDAADNIFTLSEQLLATGGRLTGIYRGLAAGRWVQPWMPYALGALALLALIARGIAAWRISREIVSRAEAERQRVDEANRENQQAILNLLDEIEGLKEGDLTVNASVGEEITGAIGDAFNDATRGAAPAGDHH